jgi:antitoxin ParD1/3/4
MRSTMNVSLPADLKKWVDRQVSEGGYGTASEYLRDVLRRARERQQRRQLDVTLVEAIEAGATIEMNDADWASIRESARAAAKKASSSPKSKRR